MLSHFFHYKVLPLELFPNSIETRWRFDRNGRRSWRKRMRKWTCRIYPILSVVFLILVFGLLNNSYVMGFQEEDATKSQKFAGISRPNPEDVPTKVQKIDGRKQYFCQRHS